MSKFLLLSTFIFLLCNKIASAGNITTINVSGNNRIDKNFIIATSGLKIGDNINNEKINTAIKRIYATGNFSDISIHEEGKTLNIDVIEAPLVGNVYFIGSSKFDSDDVKKNMSTKSRQVYSKSRIKLDIDRFYATLQKMGYLHSNVEAKVVFLKDSNAVDVIFNITEGNLSKITKIVFEGNDNFWDRTLKEQILSKELSAMQIDYSSSSFMEGKTDMDKEMLVNFYQNRGYAKANVEKIITSFDKKNYDFRVLFKINEGEKYKFGKSEILTTDIKFQNDKKLKKLISTKENQTFDKRKILETTTNLSQYLATNGYANIKPTYEIKFDDDKKIADIEYSLKITNKVYIDRIIVSGNHKTKNHIILRELEIHEGDLYDKEKIELSKDRLIMLGYFKDVQILEQSIPYTDLVQLEIVVEENFFGHLNFSLGYSGYYGIIGSASVTIHNFLGRGLTVGAGIERSGYMESYSLHFSDPYFFSNHNIGFSASARYSRFGDIGGGTQYTSMMLYKGYNFGFTVGLSFELANRLSFSTTISASRYVYRQMAESGYKLYEQLMGSRNSYILGFGLTYNRMNRPRYPTSGYMLQYQVDFGGFGIPDSQQFIRNIVNIAGNLQILGEDLILHGEGSAGIVNSLKKGQIIGMENLFSLGGYSRMRGFNFYGIGKKKKKTYIFSNQYQDMYYATEGTKFYYMSLELRSPLFIPKDYGIFFSTFIDAGSVWGFAGNTISALDIANGNLLLLNRETIKDSSNIRMSAGVAITWRNPIIGQIGFYYAKPILKQEFDTTLEFGITMGTQF